MFYCITAERKDREREACLRMEANSPKEVAMFPAAQRFVAALVLVAVGISVDGCPNAPEPFSFYYSPLSGREVPITLYNGTLALVPEEGLTAEEVAAIIDGDPFLEGSSEGDGYTIVGIVGGPTNDEILAIIDRLNATPGVDWANPIVSWRYRWTRPRESSSGILQAVDVEFIAEFPLSASPGDVETLNAEEAVDVLLIEEGSNSILYHLRITPDSTRSTLDMANFYHEHDLTLRAYPQFLIGARS